MKVSLSWLKDHLDTTASLEEIVEKSSALGLVVDDVVHAGEKLSDFIIAEIIEAVPHPQADRLQVCRVNTGKDILQVVCGAPNARAGLKSVFAPIGSTIPANGMVLKPTRIRDVESAGMMCSYAELNIESAEQGKIIELDADAPVGGKYIDYVGLDDPMMDIDVTPNRGDCLAIRGVARDLAAAGIGKLKAQALQTVSGSFASPVSVENRLSADSKNACPVFMGRVIRNVKNRPSPEWLQRKLRSVGMRPISALVDITNYMAVDWARPMHVFDMDKLQGDLVIRLAEDGEKLEALDDKEYSLDNTMTVIADKSGPLSLAGIMGGKKSGCSDSTTSVFLESALFDRISIAMTGRKTGIHSDSRARFERGVDAALVKSGLERATQLILEICGGEASEIIEVGQANLQNKHITFNASLIKHHGGLEVSPVEVQEILGKLGFKVTLSADPLQMEVEVPTWRHDVEIPYDLVEEILRIKGYDTIPAVSLPHHTINAHFESVPGSRSRQQREWIARRTLAARGICEALTWSFTREDLAGFFGGGNTALILDNPISQDLSEMRPSLLPNLVMAVGKSLAKGQLMPAFYEVGAQFHDTTPSGQKTVVSGVRSGRNIPRHWQENNDHLSVYTVKEDALATLAACGIDPEALQIDTNHTNLHTFFQNAINNA